MTGLTRRPEKRRQLFPCFIAVDEVPPLVIGNAALLEAKIRLLLKFAPLVDLVTDLRPTSRLGSDDRVTVLEEVSCQQAHDLIAGRPLVILDTGDDVLNVSLSAAARVAGVPVNVPDDAALSSAYLGAVVDRSPVLIAISTAGAAPVLGQRLRARIETILPARFGRIATYLNRRRASLQALPPARRRAIQHHLIDGQAADHIIAGEDDAADRLLARLISDTGERDSGQLKIVDIGGGDAGLLSLRGVETIRNADIIVREAGTAPAIIDLMRREASLVTLPSDLSGSPMRSFIDDLSAGLAGGQLVVLLPTGPTPAMAAFIECLSDTGLCGSVIPAARPFLLPAIACPLDPPDGATDDMPANPGLIGSPARPGANQHMGGPA